MESPISFGSYSSVLQDTNSEPQILKQISEVEFPSLKLITLIKNNIRSIEGFTKVHMPSLAKLNLSKDIKIKVTTIFIL